MHMKAEARLFVKGLERMHVLSVTEIEETSVLIRHDDLCVCVF